MLLAGGGVAVALVLMLWVLRARVLLVRGELAAREAALEQQLTVAAQDVSLRDELSRRAHDVERIERMVPQPDALDAVLTALEAEAVRYHVEVTATAGEAGAEEESRALVLVPFAITASGEPTDLVRFMHAAEHLPYLVGFSSFSLTVVQRDVAAGALLGPAGLPPGFREAEQTESRGELSAELQVAVREL